MKNKVSDNALFRNDVQPRTVLLTADIISGVLLLLFLYTSLSKLADHQTFKVILSSSPLLKPVVGIIAWLLPVTEIMIAVFLFIPVTRGKGLKASFVLLFIFTLYLVYMVIFTPDLPCNCGGVLQSLTWKQHIFFNLFSMLLSFAGIVLHKKNHNRKSKPPP